MLSFDIFGRILDLLCPPNCLFCGESMDEAGPACEKCVEKLATPDGMFCRRCGGRRFQRVRDGEIDACRRCRTTDFRFRRVIALGEYEQDLRSAILRMKTERSGLSVRAAAELLWTRRGPEIRESVPDFVVPVPMHGRRRWSRGVNSPDLLAECLAAFLNIPVYKRLLRRTRSTELQYTLSARDRRANVEDAFSVAATGLQRRIEGKNALLVDDILTTGATCNELSRLLIRSGVRGVTVCVLARSEGAYLKDHDTHGEKG